jgi:hypothetical protein
MKKGTTELIKFQMLRTRLGENRRCVAGLLECLWQGVASNCMHGDIGRFSDEEIAAMVDWNGNGAELIDHLVGTGWLDRHSEFRLVVHDWSTHAPNYVKGNVKQSGKPFADRVPGALPRTPLGTPDSPTPGDVPGAIPATPPPSLTLPSLVKSNPTSPNQDTLVQPAVARADVFDLFWAEVHLRKSKQEARTKYALAVKRIRAEGKHADPHAFLRERMRAFAESPEAHPTDRAPIHPSTWLSKGRYDDDPETWKESGNGKPDRKDSSIFTDEMRDNKTPIDEF